MLAGKSKLHPEEKARREQMQQALCPGLYLEFINSDYHEDDQTPHGFTVMGDVVKLIRIVGELPVVDGKTGERVGSHNVWEVETHWGLKDKDEYYLAAMCKVKDEAQG